MSVYKREWETPKGKASAAWYWKFEIGGAKSHLRARNPKNKRQKARTEAEARAFEAIAITRVVEGLPIFDGDPLPSKSGPWTFARFIEERYRPLAKQGHRHYENGAKLSKQSSSAKPTAKCESKSGQASRSSGSTTNTERKSGISAKHEAPAETDISRWRFSFRNKRLELWPKTQSQSTPPAVGWKCFNSKNLPYLPTETTGQSKPLLPTGWECRAHARHLKRRLLVAAPESARKRLERRSPPKPNSLPQTDAASPSVRRECSQLTS